MWTVDGNVGNVYGLWIEMKLR